jgi:hypothetical protein
LFQILLVALQPSLGLGQRARTGRDGQNIVVPQESQEMVHP